VSSPGTPEVSSASDFASRAATYDELRPVEPGKFDWLAEVGDLRGRRVLDVGCGTGQVTVALAERYGAQAWGVDPSAEMLAVARRKAPDGISFELGSAENLPFADGSFDAAFMALVVHHLDRPLAFREIFRILVPEGRLGISTPDPGGFDKQWMSKSDPRSIRRSISRELALKRLHGRWSSTFELLPPDEIATGIARAEREVPDRVEYTLGWLTVIAQR